MKPLMKLMNLDVKLMNNHLILLTNLNYNLVGNKHRIKLMMIKLNKVKKVKNKYQILLLNKTSFKTEKK